MKKFIIFTMLLICAVSLNAQDNIILKNSDTIKCKIDSIDVNSIYFTIDSDYYLVDFVDVASYNKNTTTTFKNTFETSTDTSYNVAKNTLENTNIVYSVAENKNINENVVKNNSYTASDGHTYYIGDTIKMNIGSKDNGDFNYLQMGGLSNTLSILNGDYNNINSSLGRNFSGLNVIIKKIKTSKLKGGESTYFVVGGGNITNYNLFIEQAIKTGEIVIKGFTSDGALIELKKYKDKLDLDLITQTEYDKKKAELIKYIK